MKKVFSIVIVITILVISLATASADQVWRDADGIMSTENNNSFNLSFYPDQHLEIDNTESLIKESLNNENVIFPLTGSITVDGKVTLSSSIWIVSGFNQFAYINASGNALPKTKSLRIYYSAIIPTKNTSHNI